MFQSSGCWVGVDVSKDWLDIVFGSTGKPFRASNNRPGFAQIVQQLRSTAVAGITVESTGFYHRGLAEALAEHGFPPSIVNPKQIKDYRKSGLKLAKTDQLDARLLARFGEERQPPVVFPRHASWQVLTDLVSTRSSFVVGMTRWKNRRKNPYLPAAVCAEIDAIIEMHTQTIARLTGQIASVIAADPELAHRDALLQSVPGIALVRSATFLAFVPELGTVPNEVLTSLVGLAPHADDSGQRTGNRYTRRGRGKVKGELFMLACTNRSAPAIVARRQRLIAKGKPALVADTAVARWVLTILNTMVLQDLRWEELDINRMP